MSNKCLEVEFLKQIPTSLELIEGLNNLEKIAQINLDSVQFKSQIQSFSQSHMILYKFQNDTELKTQKICFIRQQRYQDFYINQLTGEIMKVNPLQGLIIQRKNSELAKLDEVKHKAINLLFEKLTIYVKEHFHQQYVFTCHFQLKENQIESIIIGLTSKLFNPTNYYTGEWTSYWKFKKYEYQAKIHARNHFSEGGNILFQRPKQIHKKFENDQFILLKNISEEIVTKIIGIIEKEEKLYLKQLQTITTINLANSLKKLRRISPLAQGKMIWNVNAVTLLSQGLRGKTPFLR